MVIVLTHDFLPFRRHFIHRRIPVLVGGRHFHPSGHAQNIRVIEEPLVLYLLMHSHAVETEFLDQLQFLHNRLFVGISHSRFPVIALFQHHFQISGAVIEDERIPLCIKGAEAEIGARHIDHFLSAL